MKRFFYVNFVEKTKIDWNFTNKISLLFKEAEAFEGINKTNVYKSVIHDDIIYDVMIEIQAENVEALDKLMESEVISKWHETYDSIIEDEVLRDFIKK